MNYTVSVAKGNTIPRGLVHEIHTHSYKYLIQRMHFISVCPLSWVVDRKEVNV